jgi:hypothetical protein
MQTITISSNDEHTPDVTYTSAEVARFVNDARALKEREAILLDKVYHLRRQVREFFKDQEWDRSEITVNKKDVNELLEELGCDKLTTEYRGTFTITGTFNVEASDEDEAESMISDETEVTNYAGGMDVEQIEVFDIEENE